MKLINDIIAIISSLSFIDYILYFSVLALLILTFALIYVLKNDDDETENESIGSEEMKETDIDLQTIAQNIVEKKPPIVDMTAYEEEQEQKAIISYDELKKESNKKQLQYDKIELIDDIIPAKKINLTDMIKDQNADKDEETTTFHYEREEAFLQTLKELNSLLN